MQKRITNPTTGKPFILTLVTDTLNGAVSCTQAYVGYRQADETPMHKADASAINARLQRDVAFHQYNSEEALDRALAEYFGALGFDKLEFL